MDGVARGSAASATSAAGLVVVVELPAEHADTSSAATASSAPPALWVRLRRLPCRLLLLRRTSTSLGRLG
ncbi:hypothetical protein [Streptomyces sp. NPDC010273]|uniref:hypothetical protein n=1 Tax=Streptomyces sp. NPDC010273 TaxID=3364829 RepID=UPI0036E26E42